MVGVEDVECAIWVVAECFIFRGGWLGLDTWIPVLTFTQWGLLLPIRTLVATRASPAFIVHMPPVALQWFGIGPDQLSGTIPVGWRLPDGLQVSVAVQTSQCVRACVRACAHSSVVIMVPRHR